MKWDRYVAENLHFHMTVAENCGERFSEAFRIAIERVQRIETSFSNITLLREIGSSDGIDLWESVQSFELAQSLTPLA
jgi:hypothetical protein